MKLSASKLLIMPRRSRQFKYAELPVFKYQTFNPESLTYTDHPIIPPDRISFTDRNADDLFKSEEPAALHMEILELDPPAKDEHADDKPAEDGMCLSYLAKDTD